MIRKIRSGGSFIRDFGDAINNFVGRVEASATACLTLGARDKGDIPIDENPLIRSITSTSEEEFRRMRELEFQERRETDTRFQEVRRIYSGKHLKAYEIVRRENGGKTSTEISCGMISGNSI